MTTRTRITTIGHGTATADAFAELVRRAGVETAHPVTPGARRAGSHVVYDDLN